MSLRVRTLVLLALLATGVGAGIGAGAGVYYPSRSPSCASPGNTPDPNAPCSHQSLEDITIMDDYNSSADGLVHFLVYNPGPSPVTLADIFIDNSRVNYTLSSSSGIGSGCSENPSLVRPSAYCVVNALAPNPSSTSHSVVIFTALGSKFSQNITASA